MTGGICAATVHVGDQAKAHAWYTEVPGMEVTIEAPFEGGIRWREVAPPRAPTNRLLVHCYGGWTREKVDTETGMVLTAADVEATFRDLSAKGVLFPMPPQQFGWGWNAVLADPDGNSFALSQSGS